LPKRQFNSLKKLPLAFKKFWPDISVIVLLSLLAILMWSISIIGLWYKLSVNTIIVCILFSGILSTCVAYWTRGIRIDISAVWLVLILSIIPLSAVFLVVFIPPFSFDEVAYGAALPRDYAIANHFFYNASYGPYSAFPQNYEAITTVSQLLLNSPILSKILNFWMIAGLALATSVLSTFAGTSRRIAVLAGLIVICTPTLLAGAPIAKNDIANALFQAWSIVMLLSYQRERNISAVVLFALFLGTALGIKYNSMLFAFPVCSTFLWLTWTARLSHRERINHIVVFSVIVVLFSAPWYLRNWLQFGNPFFPIANEIFVNLFGIQNNFTTLQSKLFREVMYEYSNFSWDTGTLACFAKTFLRQFGPICVIGSLGIASTIWRKRSDIENLLVILCVTLVAITLRFGFWEPRYVIVIAVLLAAISASLINRVIRHKIERMQKKQINVIYSGIVATILVLGFSYGTYIYGSLKTQYQTEPNEIFLEEHVASWDVADYLNRYIPINSKVAVGVGVMQPFYYIKRPYYHMHPLTELGNLTAVKSSDDFSLLLKQQGIEYIALLKWDPGSSYTTQRTPLLHDFLNSIYAATDGLVVRHELLPIKVIRDVTIYKVSNIAERH